MEENKKETLDDSKNFKKGFFKKVWYSVFKIERYPEMATEGVARALTYLTKLAIIIAIIVSARNYIPN